MQVSFWKEVNGRKVGFTAFGTAVIVLITPVNPDLVAAINSLPAAQQEAINTTPLIPYVDDKMYIHHIPGWCQYYMLTVPSYSKAPTLARIFKQAVK